MPSLYRTNRIYSEIEWRTAYRYFKLLKIIFRTKTKEKSKRKTNISSIILNFFPFFSGLATKTRGRHHKRSEPPRIKMNSKETKSVLHKETETPSELLGLRRENNKGTIIKVRSAFEINDLFGSRARRVPRWRAGWEPGARPETAVAAVAEHLRIFSEESSDGGG